jgi:hypothetical protein
LCSILSVEETRVPGENHQTFESNWQTLTNNVVSSTPCDFGNLTHNYWLDRLFARRHQRLFAIIYVGSLTIIWLVGN